MRCLLSLTLLLGVVVLAACETTFDPFEESDATFSLFGYVDAAADTQFVRVSALRESAFEEEQADAVVTLEDLGSGTVVTLRDSLVRFNTGAIVHNYWTEAPVQPSTAYRLTATAADGRAASALFETPPQFPTPELDAGVSPISSPQNPPDLHSMRFAGIEKMADLRVTYQLTDPSTVVTVSYLDRVRRAEDGRFIVSLRAYDDVQRALSGSVGLGCPGLRSARVFVAAATLEWPDVLGLDPETLALPNTVLNVEGGLGYVGGVVTWEGEWGDMRDAFSFLQAGCLE